MVLFKYKKSKTNQNLNSDRNEDFTKLLNFMHTSLDPSGHWSGGGGVL